jgi:hypothetical protein
VPLSLDPALLWACLSGLPDAHLARHVARGCVNQKLHKMRALYAKPSVNQLLVHKHGTSGAPGYV